MAGKKTLLELPEELLSIVFNFLVEVHGVKAGIGVRRTCSEFIDGLELTF